MTKLKVFIIFLVSGYFILAMLMPTDDEIRKASYERLEKQN